MEHVTKDELLKAILKENGALQHQLVQVRSDIDYVAMMTEVEIETAAEGEGEIGQV